jgi:hypothetical protein
MFASVREVPLPQKENTRVDLLAVRKIHERK